MIETAAVVIGLLIHFYALDRRLIRVESDISWLRKYISDEEKE